MPSEMTDIDLYQGLCNAYTVIIYLHSILFAKVITILERFVFLFLYKLITSILRD